jgi:hypothetical protein
MHDLMMIPQSPLIVALAPQSSPKAGAARYYTVVPRKFLLQLPVLSGIPARQWIG